MSPFLAYTATNPFFSRFAVGLGLQAASTGPLFITKVTVTGWLWSLLIGLPPFHSPSFCCFFGFVGFPCLPLPFFLPLLVCVLFTLLTLLALFDKYVLYGEDVKIAADSDLRVHFLRFFCLFLEGGIGLVTDYLFQVGGLVLPPLLDPLECSYNDQHIRLCLWTIGRWVKSCSPLHKL